MSLMKNIYNMAKKDIIADASFYICFLDCIGCPDSLIKMVNNFYFHVPQKILEEIERC